MKLLIQKMKKIIPVLLLFFLLTVKNKEFIIHLKFHQIEI